MWARAVPEGPCSASVCTLSQSPSTPRAGVVTLACEACAFRERAWWAPAPATLPRRPGAHFHLQLHLDLPTARNAASATLCWKS